MIAVAIALLLSGVSGRAGVQIVSQSTTARIAGLHLHGLPGEQEYVRAHHEPAPFVPSHCHGPPPSTVSQPGPDDVLAAGSLAGSALCAVFNRGAAEPQVIVTRIASPAPVMSGITVRPHIPPPQS